MKRLILICLMFTFVLAFQGKKDIDVSVPQVSDRYSVPSNDQPIIEQKEQPLSTSNQAPYAYSEAVNPEDYPILRYGPDITIYNGSVSWDSWAYLNYIEDEAISVDYHRGDTLIAAVACTDSLIRTFKSYDNGKTWDYVRWFAAGGAMKEPEIIYGSNGAWYHMIARTTSGNGDIICFNVEGDESDYNYHWIEATADTVRNFTLCSDKADNLSNYYLFLAFHKGLGGNFADCVFFSRSTDRGVTWSGPTLNLQNGAGFPDLADGDGETYLAFYGKQSANRDIGVRKSTDNGLNWGTVTLVESDTATKQTPKVAVSHDGSSDAWVMWSRRYPGTPPDFDLRYSWTTNGGISWLSSAYAMSMVDSSEILPDMAIYDGYGSTSDDPYVTFINVKYDFGGPVNVKTFTWYDSDSAWGAAEGTWNDHNAAITKPVQTWEDADLPALAYVGAGGANAYFDSWSNTQVKEDKGLAVNNTLISRINPNPFTSTTHIEYTLPAKDRVSIRVFNSLGQEITTLFEGVKEAGTYNLEWNGIDKNGLRLSNGIYFMKLATSTAKATQKIILE